MPFKEKVLGRIGAITSDYWWFDDAYFLYRSRDPPVFGCVFDFARDQSKRLDVDDRYAQGLLLKRHLHKCCGRFARHDQTGAPACNRSAKFLGRVPSPSARSIVRKFSSAMSFRIASVTKMSRFRVAFTFWIKRRLRATFSR